MNEFVYQATSNGNAVFFAAYEETNLPDSYRQSHIYRAEYNAPNGTAPMALSTEPIVGRVKVVTADCERVYFAIEYDSTMANGQQYLPGRVGFVPTMGGAATMIPLRGGQMQELGVENMIADGMFVIWTSNDGLNVWRKEPVVMSPPSQIATKVGSADAVGVAFAPPYVYWSEVDFTVKPARGYIRRALMGPGTPSNWPKHDIAEFDGMPRGIAVDAMHVYFSDSGPEMDANNAIKRVSREPPPMMPSPPPETIVAKSDPMQTMGYSVGLDPEFIYYITAIDGIGITHRVRRTGADHIELSKDNGFYERWLTIDNRRVYMLDPAKGQIWWVAK